MDLLEKYQQYDPECAMAFTYITENNLMEKLDKIVKNENTTEMFSDLFTFSIKYGILSFVTFLYEEMNMSYDMNIFNDFIFTFEAADKPDKAIDTAVTTNHTEKTRFSCAQDDKFSKKRKECLVYLYNMRRYSRYYSRNKKFMYQFNKQKYKGQVRR
jgi:hypothetical protein